MSWANFFSNKATEKRSPLLEALVVAVVDYVRSRPSQDEFFPSIVAASLHESELAVLTAFGELDDQGIATPIYLTYCRTDGENLNEYATRAAIEDPEFCSTGDHCVSLENESMYFEVAFRINRQTLLEWRRQAA